MCVNATVQYKTDITFLHYYGERREWKYEENNVVKLKGYLK